MGHLGEGLYLRVCWWDGHDGVGVVVVSWLHVFFVGGFDDGDIVDVFMGGHPCLAG